MADNQGSFVTGLTIGMFAGAAGYFLFGTNKGKALRQELEKEWASAQADLQSRSSQTSVVESLSPSLKQVFNSIIELVRQQQADGDVVAESLKRKTKVKAQKPSSKFKGV